jgi:hypothetical protein
VRAGAAAISNVTPGRLPVEIHLRQAGATQLQRAAATLALRTRSGAPPGRAGRARRRGKVSAAAVIMPVCGTR